MPGLFRAAAFGVIGVLALNGCTTSPVPAEQNASSEAFRASIYYWADYQAIFEVERAAVRQILLETYKRGKFDHPISEAWIRENMGVLNTATVDEIAAQLGPENLIDVREYDAVDSSDSAGIGAMLTWSNDTLSVLEVAPGSLAEQSGLYPGIVIRSVNGQRATKSKSFSILNLFSKDSLLSLEVIDRGSSEAQQITISPSSDGALPSLETQQSGDTLMIRLRRFDRDTAIAIGEALSQATDITLIELDLRGCPGGILDVVVDTASLFLNGEVIGSIVGKDAEDLTVKKTSLGDPSKGLPLTILVDGGTASGAEWFANGLKAIGRAEIVGEPTFGDTTVRTVIPLDGEEKLLLLKTHDMVGPSNT